MCRQVQESREDTLCTSNILLETLLWVGGREEEVPPTVSASRPANLRGRISGSLQNHMCVMAHFHMLVRSHTKDKETLHFPVPSCSLQSAVSSQSFILCCCATFSRT